MPASAAEQLLCHYDRNARLLPWRSRAGDPAPDPYRIWLSEVMLQQTSVAAVVPRFRRFLERWPTIDALAAASDAEVLSEWAGLGYYARARNLIACARKVAAMGGFPRTEDGLAELPGVGAYTAAAIAAIAFGERATPVDTNVTRVLARYHGIRAEAGRARALVRPRAVAMTPAARAGDFAQALMDLGASLCRPKDPDCSPCPLADGCVARASGDPQSYPAPAQRRTRPHRHGIGWWTQRGGRLWLVRRPASGLLGGMVALPGLEWDDTHPAAAPLASVHHGFTHFTLDLHLYHRPDPVGEGWWQSLDTLGSAGLPTLYRKAVDAMLSRKERHAP